MTKGAEKRLGRFVFNCWGVVATMRMTARLQHVSCLKEADGLSEMCGLVICEPLLDEYGWTNPWRGLNCGASPQLNHETRPPSAHFNASC